MFAAVVMPLVLVGAMVMVRYARAERDRYVQDALQHARQIVLLVDGELTRLSALMQGLSVSSALAEGDLERFHREARQIANGQGEVVLLRDFGTNQILDSSVSFGTALPAAIPLGAEEQAALAAGRTLVSDVYIGPVSGSPRVAVAMPIPRPGAGPYVLAVTIPTTRVRDVIRPAVPPGWIIAIGDSRGRYVARSERHEEVSGQPGVPDYVSRVVGPAGTFTSVNFEGVVLLAGYARSGLSNWFAAANVPEELVAEPLRRSLAGALAAVLAGLLVSAGFAWLLGQKLATASRRLAARALALGAGEPARETIDHPAEFAIVAEAFDEAAAAIAERARERRQAVEREALLGSVLDSAELHAGILEPDRDDFRIAVANRGAALILGGDGAGLDGTAARDTAMDEATRAKLLEIVQDTVRQEAPISAEYRIKLAGLPSRWCLGTFRPFTDADGMKRVAFASVDITARRKAERALRERSIELEGILATVPAAVVITYDRELRTVVPNRYASELLALPVSEKGLAEIPFQPDVVGILRENVPYATEDLPLTRAAAGHDTRDLEVTIRYRDGSERTVLTNAIPLRDGNGAILGAVSVSLDISERKRADRQRQLLVHELNHRVKNTLAIVQSLAGQTLRSARTLEAARTALDQRLVALSKAHDILTRENWEGAEIADVVAAAIRVQSDPARFEVEGPPVWLPPSLAVTLSLVFHELATNALKYGALSVPEGRVEIAWTLRPAAAGAGAGLDLVWTERGGPTVAPPRQRGFGTRMIERSVAGERTGKVRLDFAPDGLRCSIAVTLPEQQETDEAPSALRLQRML
ncbi:sensor histidine kinase [Prosthecomicrobium sp. N25]|uniref:sensor histidine kinase n=1 Tax=Prosthecomicrobium sp. N25 TaxID=3129254 RepID=UPI003076B6FD